MSGSSWIHKEPGALSMTEHTYAAASRQSTPVSESLRVRLSKPTTTSAKNEFIDFAVSARVL